MEAMFTFMDKDLDAQELTPMQLKHLMINIHATFDRWTGLLKQLMGQCNNLLQLNIVASNKVQYKHKATTIEKEIVEMLMESRVHHQSPLQEVWIATVNHCVELAKVRLSTVIDGGFQHKDLLRKTWTQEEQRILLDESQKTMPTVQR